MYNILYKIYFIISRSLRIKETPKKRKAIGYIEAYFNLYLVRFFKCNRFKKFGLNKKNRNQKIIVSLTSFPKRISTVWITIETIMRQSMKADEIILWLAKEQFDGLNSLPKNLLDLQSRGLSIRFCDDLKSHKKYFYTMQEYKKDLIILFDDDMFYPKDTIKKLYNMHIRHPKDICVITSQQIRDTVYDKPSLWKNPDIKQNICNSRSVQVFTGSGSLFVPECLDKDVFDKKLIKKLCPYADDLWLTFMAFKNGTRITSLSKWRAFPVAIYGTNENSLWYINCQNGMNDEQWANLVKYYSNDFKRIEEEYELDKK